MIEISHWPDHFESILNDIGYSFKQPKPLAKAILALSNHYQDQDSKTPWNSKEGQAAYFSYYFPLNLVRIREVIRIALKQTLFDSEMSVTDFGCGPAVAAFALPDQFIAEYWGIEECKEPVARYKTISPKPLFPVQFIKSPAQVAKKDLALLSYSLNEYSQLPQEVLEFENIIVIEPSTQQAGRELLKVRKQLTQSGYHVHAPCLHQGDCPLLVESKKDWCHHRIDFVAPNWLENIEEHLPMTNNDLTLSYLIVSKHPAPTYDQNKFRVTGDLRSEKGKCKIMACRNSDREFLSWLKKEKINPELRRGDLVEVTDFEKKANEIRPGANFNVIRSLEWPD